MIYQDFQNYLTNTLNPTLLKDQKLVKRALVLFRQGKVLNITIENTQLLGNITDFNETYITLNFIEPHKSQCSCEAERICEHKIALFFSFLNQFSSVTNWVNEWKNSRLSINHYSSHQFDWLEQNYETWVDFFEKNLALLLPRENEVDRINIYSFLTLFEDAIDNQKPTEYEWILLYKSVGYLSALKYIWSLTNNAILSQLNQQLFDRFKTMINLYNQSPIFFQADSFHQSLLAETRHQIFLESGFSDAKWHIYRLIWSPRISTVKQRTEEINYLKENQGDEFYLWASVHLLFTNKEDSSALNSLRSANLNHLENVLILLEEFILKKEFSRILPIVEWMIKGYSDFLKNLTSNELLFRSFSKKMRIIALETNRLDLLEKFYKECLPATDKDYLTLLYNQKKYTKWLDLLFVSQRESLMIYSDEIKSIEKTNPEIALPFYHREIQLLILQKDRTSYKQAARLLKQLKLIYKKSKRDNEWEVFMYQLIKKNRRLRAFHDELKRWNLYVPSNE
ncbi:MAG: zinc finger family protein [Bacillales bacterium]|jgi:hypothetical protein|nr:zinc finger family protein [Bacillales bacterium]